MATPQTGDIYDGIEPPIDDDGDGEPVTEPEERVPNAAQRRETGELYGQGIAPTGDIDDEGDRGIQDYDDDGGQSWFEALQTSATEYGTAGTAPIDDVHDTEADDRRQAHAKDVPADHGSGGPAGR